MPGFFDYEDDLGSSICDGNRHGAAWNSFERQRQNCNMTLLRATDVRPCDPRCKLDISVEFGIVFDQIEIVELNHSIESQNEPMGEIMIEP